MLEEAVDTLQIDKSRLIEAKHPLFEGEHVHMRAHIAIVLGCDANLKGTKGVGPGKLNKVLIDVGKEASIKGCSRLDALRH